MLLPDVGPVQTDLVDVMDLFRSRVALEAEIWCCGNKSMCCGEGRQRGLPSAELTD